MYLIGLVVYALLCTALAWLLAKLFTSRARTPWVRRAVTALLAPVVFFLPLADEIVGKYQFDQLCEEAKEAKIYGTILVGEELYTPDGKWRIGLAEGDFDQRRKDWDRANKALNTYIRSDPSSNEPQEVPAAISIHRFARKLYDAKTGQILAEWTVYSTRGGRISRVFEAPIFVQVSCGPDVREIQQTILRFSR